MLSYQCICCVCRFLEVLTVLTLLNVQGGYQSEYGTYCKYLAKKKVVSGQKFECYADESVIENTSCQSGQTQRMGYDRRGTLPANWHPSVSETSNCAMEQHSIRRQVEGQQQEKVSREHRTTLLCFRNVHQQICECSVRLLYRRNNETGGGRPPSPLDETSEAVVNAVGSSDRFNGVQGGRKSSIFASASSLALSAATDIGFSGFSGDSQVITWKRCHCFYANINFFPDQ